MLHLMRQAEDGLRALGDSHLAGHWAGLRESVDQSELRVVVFGQFNRGKSTLINALLGKTVLPAKLIPTTGHVTRVVHGSVEQVRVRFRDGRHETCALSQLDTFTSLDGDGVAREDLESVEVAVDAPLLHRRLILSDTPGVCEAERQTARAREAIAHADLVLFLLDARQLLTSGERKLAIDWLVRTLGKPVVPVVNFWNMVPDGEKAALRGRLEGLARDGVVAELGKAWFEVNALGALKARLRCPSSAGMLEESQVPAFEASLRRFLVEDRGGARNALVNAALKATTDEVNRFIAMQQAMAGKSLAEIEGQREALQPKLDRLRGIRQHITTFLDAQSMTLQDRLVVSMENLIKKIEADLPAEVAKFDLQEILGGSMVWKGVTDRFRKEENQFAKKIERIVKPQVQRMLERKFAVWQQAVGANEMKAVAMDVEKHLQEEAAEYQRVMREIEQKVGIHTDPLQIQELVQRWLGTSTGGGGKFDLAGAALLEDMGWLFGAIAVDIVAEVVLHASSLWIPVVGLVFTAVRLLWRESQMREQVREKIVEAIRGGLANVSHAKKAELRKVVREGFDGLKQKVSGCIDEEVALIDASLQAIIDRKKAQEYSAEQEKARLEAARHGMTATAGRLRSLMGVA